MVKKTKQCYEKENHLINKIQLKNLYKFMPMNISQQIITLIIRKTPDSDIFDYFF